MGRREKGKWQSAEPNSQVFSTTNEPCVTVAVALHVTVAFAPPSQCVGHAAAGIAATCVMVSPVRHYSYQCGMTCCHLYGAGRVMLVWKLHNGDNGDCCVAACPQQHK